MELLTMRCRTKEGITSVHSKSLMVSSSIVAKNIMAMGSSVRRVSFPWLNSHWCNEELGGAKVRYSLCRFKFCNGQNVSRQLRQPSAPCADPPWRTPPSRDRSCRTDRHLDPSIGLEPLAREAHCGGHPTLTSAEDGTRRWLTCCWGWGKTAYLPGTLPSTRLAPFFVVFYYMHDLLII